MAQSARGALISRRSWLLACLVAPLSRLRAATSLEVTFDGDNLHVAAPQLHFLAGKPLERLRGGGSAVFLSQITLLSDERGTIFRRVSDSFGVSYDLWEETFSVTELSGNNPRSASRLTAASAEAWCLENMAISASGLPADRPFWLRFDLRTADPKDVAPQGNEPGISITRLIEILSRKPAPDNPHWTLQAGPLRLSDLARESGRGTRNG
ncbi:MAG TPA: hypothetical protein VG675_17285 [Bryobacteraceae bacterium]|nr:hypothetical protein [Bryobacteraceae bacterium]